jgi:hypothetical protein
VQGRSVLKSSEHKRKRNIVVLVIFLPAVVLLWIFGWSLYWIGHQRENVKSKPHASTEKENHVDLMPIPLEETLEIKIK